MNFASQLQAAKGDLTARQVAAAVSPLLSVRTVEDWLADRRSPPAWTHDVVLMRVAQRASIAVHDWTTVDWSKSNVEIAKALRARESTVWAARERYAAATAKRRKGRSTYDLTDWSLSDKEIAEQRGVSVQAVNKRRPRKQKGQNAELCRPREAKKNNE